MGMVLKPNEDTEPHVQRLFVGSYRETGMGSQDPAGVGLCVLRPATHARSFFSSQFQNQLTN